MKKFALFAALCLSCVLGAAQTVTHRFPPFDLVTSQPTGTCTAANVFEQFGAMFYGCINGSWTPIGLSVSALNPSQSYAGGAISAATWAAGFNVLRFNGSHSFTGTGWYNNIFSGPFNNYSYDVPGVNFAVPTYGASGHGQDFPFYYSAISRSSNFLEPGTHLQQNSPSDSGVYDTFWSQGGTVINGDDEGHFHHNYNGGEAGDVIGGTVTGSGTTSVTGFYVTQTCQSGCPQWDAPTGQYVGGDAGDMRYMLLTSTPLASGHLESCTATSGLIPGTCTIDTTVPVSTAWGLLAADCGPTTVISPVGTASAATTCSVSLNGITAYGNSPGNFAPGDEVCFGGQFHECASITSVGTPDGSHVQTITLPLMKPHQSGSIVMANGAADTYLDLLVNRGANGRSATLLKYPVDVIGSIASNKIVEGIWFRSNASTVESITNAGSPLMLGTTPFLVTLTNTSGTVNMVLNNGTQFYPTWNGQDIYISNATDSTFDGACTNFTYNALTSTGTCSQASSIGHTSASASAVLNCTSLGIGCTANPYGNGDFDLWEGAEVRDIQNPNVNATCTAAGFASSYCTNMADGTYFALEPNPWTWTIGTSIEEEHTPGMQYQEKHALSFQANKTSNESAGIAEAVVGDGWGISALDTNGGVLGHFDGSTVFGGDNENPFSKYIYWGGGAWYPPDAYDFYGPVSHPFATAFAPAFGMPLLYSGCPGLVGSKGGCTDPGYWYYALDLAGNVGGDYALQYWPATNTLIDNNPTNDKVKFGTIYQWKSGTGWLQVMDTRYLAGAGSYVPTLANNTGYTHANIVLFLGTNGEMQDSGEGLTGAGVAVPTVASTSTTANDVVIESNTTAEQSDSGVSINSLCRSNGTNCPGGTMQSVVIASPCTTPTAAFSTCSTVETGVFSPAFADTNYAISCSGAGTMTGSVTGIWVTSKTTTGFTVNLQNGDANGAVASTYAEIDCNAHHN